MDTKIVASLAVGIAIGVGAMLLYRPSATGDGASLPAPGPDYYGDTIAVEPCSYFQCLFSASGQLIGYGTLEGYYRLETVPASGEDAAIPQPAERCDRFIVTKGSEPLLDRFRSAIAAGNTLSRLEGSKLVINLDLKDVNLDPALAARIRSSTEATPISIGVLQTYLPGKGATACTSLIRVLNDNLVQI